MTTLRSPAVALAIFGLSAASHGQNVGLILLYDDTLIGSLASTTAFVKWSPSFYSLHIEKE